METEFSEEGENYSANPVSNDANIVNETLEQFSTDPGKWNILGDGLVLLQEYWVKKGRDRSAIY